MELRSPKLTVQLDPNAGSCVRSVIHEEAGRFSSKARGVPARRRLRPSPRRPGPQVGRVGGTRLFPNAGEACISDGVRRGFHGGAVSTPWQVVAAGRRSLPMRYEDPVRLRLTREVAVDGASLMVSNEVLNTRGSEGRPSSSSTWCSANRPLDQARGRLVPLTDTGAARIELDRAGPWPSAIWEGRLEDWSSLEPQRSSRFAALLDLVDHRVSLACGDLRVDVRWTGDTLPSPICGCGGRTRRTRGCLGNARIRCVGLEPASVPHSAGLATLLSAGAGWFSHTRVDIRAG